MSEPRHGEFVTLCWGCRAVTGQPRRADDAMPLEGLWEEFTCERCGILDVRLVAHSGRKDAPDA